MDEEEDESVRATDSESATDDDDDDDDDDRDGAAEQSDGESSKLIISEDPALWPAELTDKERVELVKKGPVQIKDIEFPINKQEDLQKKITT